MFRFAFILASKVKPSVRFVDVRPSKINIYNVGTCLSWSRNYATQDLQLGPQDKLSQNPQFLRFLRQECFLPAVSTSSLQEDENPTCEMDENGTKYIPVMREALRFGILKAMEAGANSGNILFTILPAIRAVEAHMKCKAQKISTSEQFTQVAITAANGDREIGQLVARAFEKVVTGRYILSDSLSNDVLEFYNVITLSWKPLSPFFLGGKKIRILENPIILIHENKIASENVVWQAVGLASDRRPLLIIAEGLAEEVTKLLIVLNRFQTKVKVCVVKAPDVQNRKEIMQDLAILTGGQVLTSVSEMNFKPSMLGSCKKAVVDNTKMVILGGSGSQEEIEKRCEQLRYTLDKDVEEVSLKDRLDQLSCTAAVIKVDRSNESKVGNIVDAVVSAYKSGILPGAGVALLHASKELDKFQTNNSDEKIAIQIFQNALKMPVYAMASNVGSDGSYVVKKLLDQDNPNFGYNPVKGEYEDVIKSGIVDPFKNVMKELEDMKCDVFWDVETCERKLKGC